MGLIGLSRIYFSNCQFQLPIIWRSLDFVTCLTVTPTGLRTSRWDSPGGQGVKSGWPFTKYLLIPLRTCQGSKGAKNPHSISHLFVDLWFVQSHCMINCPMAWMGLFFVVISCIQLAGFLFVCLFNDYQFYLCLMSQIGWG